MKKFYDANGKLFAYLHDDKFFQMARTGHQGGWIWGRHVFSGSGEHMGFWDNGWVRDQDGRPVGWSEGAPGEGPDISDEGSHSRHAFTAPSKTPRRGPIPNTPDFEQRWARINGRTFWTCFVDSDGESRPVGDGIGIWRQQLQRLRETAAEWGEATGYITPVSEDELAAYDSAIVSDGDDDAYEVTVADPPVPASGDLAGFEAAVASYRLAYNGDSKKALDIARVDLVAAAEKYAIRGA